MLTYKSYIMEEIINTSEIVQEAINVKAYLIYLPIALLLTVLVASILFKNSKIFMLDIFHGREEIALSTNRLFEIGFYLMNVGLALFILRMKDIFTHQEMVEHLSLKIGGFCVFLGIMVFLNLYMFFRGKRKSSQHVSQGNTVEL